MIFASGDWLIGGDIEVLERIRWNDGLDQFRLTPNELRKRFRDMKVINEFNFQINISNLLIRLIQFLLFNFEIQFIMDIHFLCKQHVNY